MCRCRSTAPQHLVCRVVPSLHINHMQMSIIEVFICRRLHMNTSTILICIWLICRLGTALHTKCCGAVKVVWVCEVLVISCVCVQGAVVFVQGAVVCVWV